MHSRDIKNSINSYLGLNLIRDAREKLDYIRINRPYYDEIIETNDLSFIDNVHILDYLRPKNANAQRDTLFLQYCVTDNVKDAVLMASKFPIYVDVRGYILCKKNNSKNMIRRFYKNKGSLYGKWTVPLMFK